MVKFKVGSSEENFGKDWKYLESKNEKNRKLVVGSQLDKSERQLGGHRKLIISVKAIFKNGGTSDSHHKSCIFLKLCGRIILYYQASP